MCNARTRGNGFKLNKEVKFLLDIRKKLCTLRAARCWNKLPREDVEVLLLNVFKARLNGALGNMI